MRMDELDVDALFDTCDRNSKGFLVLREFAELCKELNLQDDQLRELFNNIDVNSNGKIEKTEFLEQFHVIADLFFRVIEESNIENASEEPETSCQNSIKKIEKVMSWDKFSGTVGHIIFGLPSYERICELYKDLEENPIFLAKFEKMMRFVLKDVESLHESIADLEASLIRVTKQSEEQLNLLEEEMEHQLKVKEERVRSEETEKYEKEQKNERERYERRISKLQEAVDRLQQVDEKLSGISPFEREMEKLREKLRSVTSENSNLRTQIGEADTNIALLRSEVTALRLELEEKKLAYEKESEAVTMAMSEHAHMTQQVNSLYSHNQRLKYSHDDLREVLDTNMATMRRMSRLSRSPSGSCIGEQSTHSSAQGSRSGLISGRTSRASFHDFDALAKCDPGMRMTSPSMQITSPNMTSYDVDDDTEMDISLKSSLDGGQLLRLNSAFERDSGMGTTRDDVDSELEWDHIRGSRLRTSVGNRSFASLPSLRGSQRLPNRYRSKDRKLSLDDVTDDEFSNNDTTSTPSERRMRKMRKRKVIPPNPISLKGKTYKVILCGDANVGKSSFITRLCQDRFSNYTKSTLGVDFQVKRIPLSDTDDVTLQLWDTAGQERFRSIATSYFRKADGVILLYDVTCQESFINVRDWMETVTDGVPDGAPVLICGNKVDLRTDDDELSAVTPTEGAQLAANYGVLFMETSASSGVNITMGVTMLARHLATRINKEDDSSAIQRLDENVLKKIDCC